MKWVKVENKYINTNSIVYIEVKDFPSSRHGVAFSEIRVVFDFANSINRFSNSRDPAAVKTDPAGGVKEIKYSIESHKVIEELRRYGIEE